jgi:chemotaxis protein MotD
MAATAQPLKTIGATIAVQDKPVERTPATAKAAAADAKAQANADAAATTPSTADATATAKPAAAPQPHTADAPPSRPVDGIVAQPQHHAAALPQGHAPAINPPNLAQATAQVPVPLAGLALEISARAQDGSNRFEIRLDPPELGRIDVSLHVDAHGQVTSHLVVDRADTLNLLQRDSSDLERSLQQAGLKTGDNGLQFSLRDQSFGSAPDNSGRPAARVIVPEIEAPAADIMARSYTRAGQGTGLDIRV